MIGPGQGLSALLSQHNDYLLAHAARFDQKLQLLHTLKQGTELLLLVSSYLFYYLIDCIAQVLSMPIVR